MDDRKEADVFEETFTMDTQEAFPPGWLATRYTDLQATEQNKVEYNYYEKPTWLCRRAVQ